MVKMGAEARITVDFDPKHAVAGYVSFVSPEAQFTPKEVETKSEREKLMFRVKIQVPKEIVTHYIERVKTGVRGVGYVKVKESAEWPDWLNRNLVQPGEPPQQQLPPQPPRAEPTVPPTQPPTQPTQLPPTQPPPTPTPASY